MPAASYQVTVGERVVNVHIRRVGNDVFARVDDGAEQPVALSTIHGALCSLAIGDRRTELLVAQAAEGVSAAVAGLDYHAEVLDEAHARLASVAGSRTQTHARRELKAPMPGLLVSILCQEGDEVTPGQPLAVLRAMKMENELSLPRGGKVTRITAQPGQTVEQGQSLLVIE